MELLISHTQNEIEKLVKKVIANCFARAPFVSALHCHLGSTIHRKLMCPKQLMYHLLTVKNEVAGEILTHARVLNPSIHHGSKIY